MSISFDTDAMGVSEWYLDQERKVLGTVYLKHPSGY